MSPVKILCRAWLVGVSVRYGLAGSRSRLTNLKIRVREGRVLARFEGKADPAWVQTGSASGGARMLLHAGRARPFQYLVRNTPRRVHIVQQHPAGSARRFHPDVAHVEDPLGKRLIHADILNPRQHQVS